MRGEQHKPNFLGIGAQKCASTWLYDILSDHPEVCLSENKELDFFSNYFDFGYQWYEHQFEPVSGCRAVGEVSPSYFHTPGVPQRVKQYDPDMRLILFLREPLQRALSNHKHEVRIGHLTGADVSFERGIENNPQYVEQSLYATHLERWLQFFDRRQILIVLFDDVVVRGDEVVRRVYEFLGIDTAHEPAALKQRSNESYVNRSPTLEKIKNAVRGLLRVLRLGWLWEALGKLGLQRVYRRLNRLQPETVIPRPQQRTIDMLRDRFAGETERLEELSGIDLARWRKHADG